MALCRYCGMLAGDPGVHMSRYGHEPALSSDRVALASAAAQTRSHMAQEHDWQTCECNDCWQERRDVDEAHAEMSRLWRER